MPYDPRGTGLFPEPKSWNGDPPDDYFEDDDGDDYDELDELQDECGLMDDGQCMMAGTEHCDFSCPWRDSEDFAGSEAWNRKHGNDHHGEGATSEEKR